MKLQRTTLILVCTALLLGGVVYLAENQRTQNQEATKTTKQPIFAFKEDQIQSVTIYQGEETLAFERVSGQTTNWRMKQPQDAPASDAAVAFLLDLLAEGKSDRSFAIQPNQLKEYGLDKPTATVKVQLKNNQVHWLDLGKPDFNRSSLYAQAKPLNQASQPLKVLLVPIDFEYAVKRPLSEWQSKSEKPESPKPSPTAGSSKLAPTAEKSQPSPTSVNPKPSPTAEKSQPTPTSKKPQPSPTSARPKPSPTAEKSQPAPTFESPKPPSNRGV
jgi:hypothetical protein